MLKRHLMAAVAAVAVTAFGLAQPASAVTAPAAAPSAAHAAHWASGAPLFDCLTTSPPTCYAPRQFLTAYGIQPLLNHGIDGRGETIVMPEFVSTAGAAGVTDIRQDVAKFDSVFGLPALKLQIITRFAGASTRFLANGEEAGDIEITHAVAPAAAIRVILLPTTGIIPVYTKALQLAASLGQVVSVTAGASEKCFTSAQLTALQAALRTDQRRHATVIASAGDSGAAASPCAAAPTFAKGVDLPASDPLVLSVGGTKLQANRKTGAYLGETVWNEPPVILPQGVVATGGGFSSVFARPAYQDKVRGVHAMRGVPDISADADLTSGIALVAVIDGGFVISGGGGTSAGAPFWAGIMALADQYAGRSLGFINPEIYAIGRSPILYHGAFHDITKGNNTVKFPTGTITGYSARPGWDPVTGWGSPNARVLVPLLARLHRQ